MEWTNLLDLLQTNADPIHGGAAFQYYWETPTLDTMYPPYSTGPILSSPDYGCGEYPYIHYVAPFETANTWMYGDPPFTADDFPVILVNNVGVNSSNTLIREVYVPASALSGVSTVRARALLRGTGGGRDNYNHARIYVAWLSNPASTSFPDNVLGSIEHGSYFDNGTWTDWFTFDVSSPPNPDDYLVFLVPLSMCNSSFGSFALHIDAAVPTPPPPGYKVYELDKGWSFDGAYIPHFLEMNWYFGDDPFTDKTIQKVRIHGLSKGLAQLQLSVAGMQHDYDSDFTEPQFINIPRNAVHISEEYIPVTNYVDSSNWGVSHQLRFEGSNTDLSKPEPSHVLQVLALQGSPQGNGKRIN